MKKEIWQNTFLGFFLVGGLLIGFFPLFLKISVKENPDKVSFIEGKYQVLDYSKSIVKGLKKHLMTVRNEKTYEIINIKIDYDCKEHSINKIINLNIRISEYSLFGFEEKEYYPFGGEVCLK